MTTIIEEIKNLLPLWVKIFEYLIKILIVIIYLVLFYKIGYEVLTLNRIEYLTFYILLLTNLKIASLHKKINKKNG